jgi:hypothetical protein
VLGELGGTKGDAGVERIEPGPSPLRGGDQVSELVAVTDRRVGLSQRGGQGGELDSGTCARVYKRMFVHVKAMAMTFRQSVTVTSIGAET